MAGDQRDECVLLLLRVGLRGIAIQPLPVRGGAALRLFKRGSLMDRAWPPAGTLKTAKYAPTSKKRARARSSISKPPTPRFE